MKKTYETYEVLSNEEISKDIFELLVSYKNNKKVIRPGMFVSIVPPNKSNILPRPISICEYDEEKEILRLIYKKIGSGTESISNVLKGEFLKIIAPLGNGFPSMSHGKQTVIIGGGIGVAPLLELAKRISTTGIRPKIYLGFRNESQVILIDEFKKYGDVTVIFDPENPVEKLRWDFPNSNLGQSLTEKFNENIGEISDGRKILPDTIYTCGPYPLMKAVSNYANEIGIDKFCYASLEERMACTIGACLACVCKTKDGYKTVCTDGPVFAVRDIVWD